MKYRLNKPLTLNNVIHMPKDTGEIILDNLDVSVISKLVNRGVISPIMDNFEAEELEEVEE
jgi:hypothetical protein